MAFTELAVTERALERPGSETASQTASDSRIASPPSLPKGGGAIRGVDEKLAVNPSNGAASASFPLPISTTSRGGVPDLALSYDSGAGNGPFGFGWHVALPNIVRRTDRGLPRYRDASESDVYVLSGAEDLVPLLVETAPGVWTRHRDEGVPEGGRTYVVERYRPRIEGLFARIERWTDASNGEIHWRSYAPDGTRSIYGSGAPTRLADPDDPRRVYQWLLEETRDVRGNVVEYLYKPEDAKDIDSNAPEERPRVARGAFAQKYLKRVRYGNRVPDVAGHYLFELVFDYGDHHPTEPTREEDPTRSWTCREDVFSTYRPGFDLRTYRLCTRVLMFHAMPENGIDDLVRAMKLEYDADPVATHLRAVELAGYTRAGALVEKTWPKIELTYSQTAFDTTVRDVAPNDLEGLFAGGGQLHPRWIDLDGEGIPGVLWSQRDQWLYKRNLGGGRLAPPRVVAERPMLAALLGNEAQLMDVDGDGRLDLVRWDDASPGMHARDLDADWLPFRPFRTCPNLAWNDPNLRFVDVDGDGLTDVLITEDDRFRFHLSLGADGFGPSETAPKAKAEASGPVLVFADREQTVFLADMTGDGLSDIVRVRNGDVSYWPNLGYGRFGPRVVMGSAPRFDDAESFDPRRIYFADLDGSGAADIVYVGRRGVTIHVNESGNRWSAPRSLDALPGVNDLTSIAVHDLLGTGTACIVWSSPLPADEGRRVRYVDLLGGVKPHLLTSMKNNLGREVHLTYTTSTKMYLEDRAAGRTWVTRLPFPVHVIASVEHIDAVMGRRLVSTYRYRHGHYDGVERELRGFGYVERTDAETIPDGPTELALPPVVTRTWLHTGVYVGGDVVARHMAAEYYRGDAHPQAAPLDDTVLPAAWTSTGPSLTGAELREACRALKGRILREETYALDDPARAGLPYRVTEHSWELLPLQPAAGQRHAVFLPHARESLDLHYERNPDDPRAVHQATLAVDAFGNVTRAASIAYPRRPDPAGSSRPAPQTTGLATMSEATFTTPIDDATHYRAPMTAESRAFELTGLALAPGDPRVAFADIDQATASAAEIGFDDMSGGGFQKRLIEDSRTLYFDDDLTNPKALGEMGAKGLVYATYRAALTPGTLALFGSRIDRAALAEAGYVEGRAIAVANDRRDDMWWIPSVRPLFDTTRPTFLSPIATIDPFGNTTHLAYDRFELFMVRFEDAKTNAVLATPDYRVLSPRLVTDANGNRSEALFDTLGMVAATAVHGKAGETLGDDLSTTPADLDDTTIAAYAADPTANAAALLGGATTRYVYDLKAFARGRPVMASAIQRETHLSDLAPGASSRLQIGLVYADGFGREILTKARVQRQDRANPAPLWLGSGWTVFDNKGNPVRRFEPFFSDTHAFEVKPTGVTITALYDPLGRGIATLHPDKTYEKVVFTPWDHASWDANDTVLLDPGTDPDVRGYVARLDPTELGPTWYERRSTGARGPLEQAAALKARDHKETPKVESLDVLGRAFRTVADNGTDATGARDLHVVLTELDVQGNARGVTDPRGVTVLTATFDMVGRAAYTKSADAGEHWTFAAVDGKPVYAWDGADGAPLTHRVHRLYDELRRPTEVRAITGTSAEIVAERTTYRDTTAAPDTTNGFGKPFEQFDGAGVTTYTQYDFKGNAASYERRFTTRYDAPPDWSTAPSLDPSESFAKTIEHDAMNRVVHLVNHHDASELRHRYDDGGLLDGVDVLLRGAGGFVPYVKSIDYNEKRQRLRCEHGNGVVANYTYDTETFRLTTLSTKRGGRDLQALAYTYDPVGNVSHIEDAAHPDVFRNDAKITASGDYTYDAIYRLVVASGREHQALASEPRYDTTDSTRRGIVFPADEQALRNYTEVYQYDKSGNVDLVQHKLGLDKNGPTIWQRRHRNDTASNRLVSTEFAGDDPTQPLPNRYDHDAHGNIVQMPHLTVLEWDHAGRLVKTVGGGVTTYYAYEPGGARVRKTVEKNGATLIEERVYCGDYERFRTRDASGPVLERQSLHVADGEKRFALVETQTLDAGAPVVKTAIRYQLDNHLGSASLELDENGSTITYEEYHPYGTTAFQAGRSSAEVSLKRYRYTGKERDEDTGLGYHHARYYIPWLGRWLSADPAGMRDGLNVYAYARCNPVSRVDGNGMDSRDVASLTHPPYSAAYQRRVEAQIAFDLAEARYQAVLHAPLPPPDPNEPERYWEKATAPSVFTSKPFNVPAWFLPLPALAALRRDADRDKYLSIEQVYTRPRQGTAALQASVNHAAWRVAETGQHVQYWTKKGVDIATSVLSLPQVATSLIPKRAPAAFGLRLLEENASAASGSVDWAKEATILGDYLQNGKGTVHSLTLVRDGETRIFGVVKGGDQLLKGGKNLNPGSEIAEILEQALKTQGVDATFLAYERQNKGWDAERLLLNFRSAWTNAGFEQLGPSWANRAGCSPICRSAQQELNTQLINWVAEGL